jgi:uncharacterized membrane protein YraQ (UPF0718 family)
MKAAAVVMLILVLVLGGLAYARGGTALLGEGLRAGGKGLAQLFPVLVVMMLLTGFVEVLLPRDVVARWLSDASGPRGLGVAWLAGVLTPGGGPVGLPIAATLMRQGAGWGVLVTYLTSMSLLSFVRIPLELGIYGPRLTVMRVVSSLVLPLLAGVTAQAIARALNAGG